MLHVQHLKCTFSLFHSVLTKILHVAATFGMVVGSELHEKAVLPKDHFIISSIIASAVSSWRLTRCQFVLSPVIQMLHVDKTSGLLHKSQFSHWVSKRCPRLLEGIRQWTKSLLLPQRELMVHRVCVCVCLLEVAKRQLSIKWFVNVFSITGG